jgi:hypothetical protein
LSSSTFLLKDNVLSTQSLLDHVALLDHEFFHLGIILAQVSIFNH